MSKTKQNKNNEQKLEDQPSRTHVFPLFRPLSLSPQMPCRRRKRAKQKGKRKKRQCCTKGDGEQGKRKKERMHGRHNTHAFTRTQRNRTESPTWYVCDGIAIPGTDSATRFHHSRRPLPHCYCSRKDIAEQRPIPRWR